MRELLQPPHGHRPALVDCRHNAVVTYSELAERVAEAARELLVSGRRRLVFHVCVNTVDSIVLYLACLETGTPVCLLEPQPADVLASLVASYAPELLLVPPEFESPVFVASERRFPHTQYRMCCLGSNHVASQAHPDLALLLTTSGSTGSPKLVRLTLDNVLANARSIVSYLGLNAEERSIQSLPMHYSYGLSLINSHLIAGGAVVLTAYSFFTPEFWRDFDQARCTSFAGVPYMYETLCRLHFNLASHPSLRTMTQAGGGLRKDLIAAVHEQALRCGTRFFVMYGQTEATARISYVPPERLGEKIGSIGIPIPGGRMETVHVAGAEEAELVYSGPNVMMGYAESADNLARGDELHGVLRTGDLVERDSDGYFFLRGRLKRMAKLFGRRISLSEIEADVETAYSGRAAVIEDGRRLLVFLEAHNGVDPAVVARQIAGRLHVPPKFISVAAINSIPMTTTGKKDYKALLA